jgi:hypothetical protein
MRGGSNLIEISHFILSVHSQNKSNIQKKTSFSLFFTS